jgi:tRNA A37 threonylcarbamoyladenosine modification protein TsaB
MNLFLDAISPKNILILFDNERKIVKEYFFDVRQNESTLLIEEVDKFLHENNLSYFDFENIVFVN